MTLVGVLPNSTAPTAPGWAYVPDTGYDPSKAPIVPSGARKRAARNAHVAAAGDQSARQQSKIARHLADLDKENNKDVQIAVPDKPRDVAKRGLRAHMTPSVKRILLSQKTFANHLADEEATLGAQASENTPNAPQRRLQAKDSKTFKSNTRNSAGGHWANDKCRDVLQNQPGHDSSASPLFLRQGPSHLLETSHASMPSSEEVEALLSLPSLSYSAARAEPTTSTAPAHSFCDMCGYWGRVRCIKCGVRICSLECKTQHEDTTCQKFYA
ncbi:MAG: hypothetical protein M1828_004765 [Chrysothrix sp. TS-e1954]|nr:MAG: hypothetical protein M1828_004765 [Chrysothrix sp. TS-e1954]